MFGQIPAYDVHFAAITKPQRSRFCVTSIIRAIIKGNSITHDGSILINH